MNETSSPAERQSVGALLLILIDWQSGKRAMQVQELRLGGRRASRSSALRASIHTGLLAVSGTHQT